MIRQWQKPVQITKMSSWNRAEVFASRSTLNKPKLANELFVFSKNDCQKLDFLIFADRSIRFLTSLCVISNEKRRSGASSPKCDRGVKTTFRSFSESLRQSNSQVQSIWHLRKDKVQQETQQNNVNKLMRSVELCWSEVLHPTLQWRFFLWSEAFSRKSISNKFHTTDNREKVQLFKSSENSHSRTIIYIPIQTSCSRDRLEKVELKPLYSKNPQHILHMIDILDFPRRNRLDNSKLR